MKKLTILTLLILTLIAIPVTFSADEFILVDDIGIAPNVRSYDDSKINFVQLSDAHAEHTAYGFGFKLDPSSTGREYITYDVEGVNAVEMSVIVNQSTFASYHGWGMSLGVSDNPAEMPGNNINNINLGQILPIYLSEDGIPFIKRNNQWMAYIEGKNVGQGKYSFAPSTTNISENLREFTVPLEVTEMLYPMMNVEVYKEVNPSIFEWVILPSTHYQYKSVTYLGGDKEYLETIRVSNIEDALQVRVGMNFTRQSLKPSTAGDIEADIYEPFGLNYFDAIYLTKVQLELDHEYADGFEDLDETNVIFDTKNSRRSFGFGESINLDDLFVLIQYDNGVTGALTSDYSIDMMDYNPLVANIYKIAVTYKEFRAEMNVEVLEPDELLIDDTNVKKHYQGNESLDFSELIVKARTNVGTQAQPLFIDTVLNTNQYTIDSSGVTIDQTGIYEVTIEMVDYDLTSALEIIVDATNLSVNPQASDPMTLIYIVVGSIVGISIIAIGGFFGYAKFIKGKKRG